MVRTALAPSVRSNVPTRPAMPHISFLEEQKLLDTDEDRQEAELVRAFEIKSPSGYGASKTFFTPLYQSSTCSKTKEATMTQSGLKSPSIRPLPGQCADHCSAVWIQPLPQCRTCFSLPFE